MRRVAGEAGVLSLELTAANRIDAPFACAGNPSISPNASTVGSSSIRSVACRWLIEVCFMKVRQFTGLANLAARPVGSVWLGPAKVFRALRRIRSEKNCTRICNQVGHSFRITTQEGQVLGGDIVDRLGGFVLARNDDANAKVAGANAARIVASLGAPFS